MPQGGFVKTIQDAASSWKVQDEYIPSSSFDVTVKITFSAPAARSSKKAEETATYAYVDCQTFGVAVNQVLEEHGLSHRSRTFAYKIDVENKTVSFDRDRCLINGLNDEELNKILSEIESKLDLKSLVTLFESSPIINNNALGNYYKLDDLEKDGVYHRTSTGSWGGFDFELYSEEELLSYDYTEHRKNYIRQLVEKGIYSEESAQHSMKNMADSDARMAALPARSAGPPPLKVMEKTTVLFSESVAGK